MLDKLKNKNNEQNNQKKLSSTNISNLFLEAKAVAKNLRITPRKIRLIINLIRGQYVNKAFSILDNVNKQGVSDVFKVVKSAFHNAINKKMDSNKLYIYSIFASDGIKMKRFMPRAKGSSSSKIKRTSNVTVIIKEK